MSLSSGDASDSICPKGWGIARLEGDGSYHKLIANVYGMNKTGITLIQSYKEPNGIRVEEFILQLFISFIRSGRYEQPTGNNNNANGEFWLKKSHSNINAYRMDFRSSDIRPQTAIYYGYGLSVRCVAKSFNL